MEVNKSMERQIQHFSHEHPLFLKAEEHKIGDADHSEIQMACCWTPNSGPIYSCEACGYFLHKVCAELPNEMNFPMHPKHTLALLSKPTYPSGEFQCDMCNQFGVKFVYNCSICSFDVDLGCASAAQTIEDICHQHPLFPIQVPSSFYCHFCGIEKKGLSYKCTICPFWIHQSCTVLIANTLNQSHHHKHPLTFLQFVPIEYNNIIDHCDICNDRLPTFHCVYYCDRCTYFSHVSCARSEIIWSSVSRDQDISTDGQRLAFLPPQPNSRDLISRSIENNIDTDANIPDQIDHFGHKHPLFSIDEQLNKEMCRACAVPIKTPSYGCRECNYFLHKCCTELPKQISHPSHPHDLRLYAGKIFECKWCRKWCNGFRYKCSDCQTFEIDIKCCLSLKSKPLYHIAHKHPLIPRLLSSLETYCSACGFRYSTGCFLHCETCSFKLCPRCAMSPPTPFRINLFST